MTNPDPWSEPIVHTVERPGADTPPPPTEPEEGD